MTTDNFCFYLQNRQIQTSQIRGQWNSDTSPLVFPGSILGSKYQTRVTVANTVAYYIVELVTAIKSFTVQAQGLL
jgi:hypothetical protein